MQHLETCLLIAEVDRVFVSSSDVVCLFFAGCTSCYQDSSVILGWFVSVRFQNISLLTSHWLMQGSVCIYQFYHDLILVVDSPWYRAGPRYDLRVECYHQLPLWVILRVAGLNPYQSTPSVDGFASATSATTVKVRFLTSIIPVDQLGSSCAQF